MVFFTLCKNYKIISINQTLLNLLGYETEQIVGREIESILPSTGRAFIQLFFYPLISKKKRVNEISLDFKAKNGTIIPVLISASQESNGEVSCVTFPIQGRNRYVKQLAGAKQEAEEQLEEIHVQNARKATLTSDLNYQKLKTQSYYQASRALSGDIYGLYPINDHQYGIILLDVMGHGLSSSLITMSLESLFQRLTSKGYGTDQVIKELDDHLHSFFHKNEEA